MEEPVNIRLQHIIDKTRKEREYLDYIKEHINNVNKAFEELLSIDNDKIKELFSSDAELVNKVRSRVKVHDGSKFEKEEFQAYRANFFPLNDKEKEDNKEAFDKAWEHHWKNNDHHWQARQDSKEFNQPACIEMIIDWMAMGYKFNDRPYEYYEKNKNEIILNELERDYTEQILNAIKEYDENN